MSNKIKYVLLFAAFAFPVASAQAEVLDQDIEITDTISVEKNADMDTDMEQVSADAVSDYQVNGSLFQQITDLEQEKVLMQLEKERAQLYLESLFLLIQIFFVYFFLLHFFEFFFYFFFLFL